MADAESMESREHTGYLNGQGVSRIQKDLHQSLGRRSVKTAHKNITTRSSTHQHETMKGGKVPHVGVVGAGFAGLRCADVLLQHGCQVTIFEARNRIGGRVAQSDHLGHLVDLGPNWIHGTSVNPIMRIAHDTETQLHDWEGGENSEAIYDADGEPLDPAEAAEYAQLMWSDGVIADAFRYSNEQHDSISSERSLFDFFEEKAAGMFVDQPTHVAERKRKTFLLAASMWGAYVGSAVTRQSLKFFWLEECIEGANAFVAETYRKILDAVAEPAQRSAVINFNKKVTGIASERSEHDVSAKPRVELSEGSSAEFDEIVVTTPLGWLKRNQAAFKPPLPPRLARAIDHIGYGTLDKVYITFNTPFWHQAPASKGATIAGDMSRSQDATLSDASPNGPFHSHLLKEEDLRGQHPGFTHWLAPTYANDTNVYQWDQQGMNLAALPGDCAHPTILFYIYGDCSKHIAEIATKPDSTPQERDAALISFFKPYYSRLPNYGADNVKCKPRAVLATAWANDEFAGYGSYSNFQVGLQKGDEDIEVMRHGMPERGVWFAGEHTAPFIALGTSTGAWWSGDGVAERILQRYEMGKGNG